MVRIWVPTLRVPPAGWVEIGKPRRARVAIRLITGLSLAALASAGCAQRHQRESERHPAPSPVVVAVAPVLNLSGSREWDSLKISDTVASELQSFPGIVVIPVNRALAELTRMGKPGIETADDALELGRRLEADVTLVTAVTEYNPYDPPVVGLIMQWYELGRQASARSTLDPVGASRAAVEVAPAGAADAVGGGPLQVQRLYNAMNECVLECVRKYDRQRGGHESPYDWRVHVKAQELFVRYCCWATIRTMLWEKGRIPRTDDQEQDD